MQNRKSRDYGIEFTSFLPRMNEADKGFAFSLLLSTAGCSIVKRILGLCICSVVVD
jgi:hypothetical protein